MLLASIMKFSIIVPVLNEAAAIKEYLMPLQSWRNSGNEIIVVDGMSTDDTVKQAQQYADKVFSVTRGRARQMNTGARAAQGEVLLFLHADTVLPEDALSQIENALQNTKRVWGRFDVRLSGSNFMFRVIEFMINLRSRLSGIATGDQAIFVLRDVFEKASMYPEIALMEDIALSKILRKQTRPVCLRARALTSSRRWERRGVWRTIILMWRLRLAYFFGKDPSLLAKKYR